MARAQESFARINAVSHGTTLPREGIINSRVAHCTHDPEESNKQYRLWYPFEDEYITKDLWWILDREKHTWRTVGWNLYDPEYEQQPQVAIDEAEDDTADTKPAGGLGWADGDDDDDDDDDLVDQFAGMEVTEHENETQKAAETERIQFISHCINNDVNLVQAYLERNPSLVTLKAVSSGNPALLVACEEGNMDIVKILVEAGADMEASDYGGNTPLLSAIQEGRYDVVDFLIEAGANDSIVVNKNGTSVVARQIQWQREQRKCYQMTVDAKSQKPDLDENGERKIHKAYNSKSECCMEYVLDDGVLFVPSAERKSDARKRLRNIDQRLEHLDNLLQLFEAKQATRRLEACLLKIMRFRGTEQEQHVRKTGHFDLDLLMNYIGNETISTPIDSIWKTAACIYRGRALPSTFAVSGWSGGPYGTRSNTLNRSHWTDQVFRLAKILQYQLPSHNRDDPKRPGSFFACHSEKQLLANFIFHHTTAFLEPGDPDEAKTAFEACNAPSLRKLAVNIFVCQPGHKKAEICHDCYHFCSTVAKRYNMTLHLRQVKQVGEVLESKIIASWPRLHEATR